MTGFCWFVALEFLLFAPLKFSPVAVGGYPTYFEKFVKWGYPWWFSMVVGGAEIVAALLLLKRRRRFLGAAILVFIMTGAVTTHIINHDALKDSISAPIHLVFAALIALAHWPASWREPLALRRGA